MSILEAKLHRMLTPQNYNVGLEKVLASIILESAEQTRSRQQCCLTSGLCSAVKVKWCTFLLGAQAHFCPEGTGVSKHGLQSYKAAS